jgi:23S rRNA (guanosine2251-2'-O)-methyltransferase
MKKNVTIVYGRNPVRSALEANHADILYVSKRLQTDSLVHFAHSSRVEVRLVDDAYLDHLCQGQLHQGFAVEVASYPTISLNEMIASAKKPYPLILILDGIEDPHNLGAILRSADAFGADGVVMKSRGEVQLNGTVAKVSTGAIDYVKIAVVPNLSQAIESLKKAGYWIVASEGSATLGYDQVDYRSPIGLVIGSEGFGISSLVVKNSDFLVKIPMCGHVNSLNASVAAGIFLSTIALLRKK